MPEPVGQDETERYLKDLEKPHAAIRLPLDQQGVGQEAAQAGRHEGCHAKHRQDDQEPDLLRREGSSFER